LATPYNQAPNYYTATSVGPVANTNQMANNSNINLAATTGTSGQSTKLKDEGSVSNNSNVSTNILSAHVSQQQVVPQTNLNKPLIQHSYTSRRVVH